MVRNQPGMASTVHDENDINKTEFTILLKWFENGSISSMVSMVSPLMASESPIGRSIASYVECSWLPDICWTSFDYTGFLYAAVSS